MSWGKLEKQINSGSNEQNRENFTCPDSDDESLALVTEWFSCEN
jgi:hypothetical protein